MKIGIFPVNILLQKLGDPPVIEQCMKGMRRDTCQEVGPLVQALITINLQAREVYHHNYWSFLSHFVRKCFNIYVILLSAQKHSGQSWWAWTLVMNPGWVGHPTVNSCEQFWKIMTEILPTVRVGSYWHFAMDSINVWRSIIPFVP